MLGAIPPQLFTGVGWGGLIVTAVWFILSGRLVPRTTHERELAQKDDHIAYLRKTLEVRDEQARIRDEQTGKLLTNSELTVQLLQAVARGAHRGDLAS